MIKKTTTFLMTMAVTAFLGLGLSTRTQATTFSYADSYMNIDSWTVTVSPGGTAIPLATSFTSEAKADLPAQISDLKTTPNYPDALVQNLGTAAKAENSFVKDGKVGYYGSGDAVINFPNGAPGSGNDNPIYRGESYVNSDVQAVGSGSGGGLNKYNQSAFITAGTVLTFDFYATPYLNAEVGLDSLGLSAFADSNLYMNLAIKDETGISIFDWSPNGALDQAILGGTEIWDSVMLGSNPDGNLNTSLHTDEFIPGPQTHNAGLGRYHYQVQTNIFLADGNYSISGAMGGDVATHFNTVPEPGTIILLGVGLLGFAGFGRKKRLFVD